MYLLGIYMSCLKRCLLRSSAHFSGWGVLYWVIQAACMFWILTHCWSHCKYFLPICGFLFGLVTKSYPTLETSWTIACKAPLSMGFSRQEYCSGLPFPSPGDRPDPGIKPGCPALRADSLPTELRCIFFLSVDIPKWLRQYVTTLTEVIFEFNMSQSFTYLYFLHHFNFIN